MISIKLDLDINGWLLERTMSRNLCSNASKNTTQLTAADVLTKVSRLFMESKQ